MDPTDRNYSRYKIICRYDTHLKNFEKKKKLMLKYKLDRIYKTIPKILIREYCV